MDPNKKNPNNLNMPGAERMERRDENDEDRGYSNRTGDLDRVENMDTSLDSGLDEVDRERGDVLDSTVDHEKLDRHDGANVPGDSDIDLNYDRDPMRRNTMYGPESQRGSNPEDTSRGSNTGEGE